MLIDDELIKYFCKKIKAIPKPNQAVELGFSSLVKVIKDLFRRDGNKTQQLVTHCKDISVL